MTKSTVSAFEEKMCNTYKNKHKLFGWGEGTKGKDHIESTFMDEFALRHLPSTEDNCNGIESEFSAGVDQGPDRTTLISCTGDGVRDMSYLYLPKRRFSTNLELDQHSGIKVKIQLHSLLSRGLSLVLVCLFAL